MSLQTIVSNSPLADDIKEQLLTKLLTDGATDEVVAEIKDALQEYIDAGFKTMGLAVDPNDPKVKAAQQAFDEEISAAEAEYNEEMENLSIDAAVIQAKANKDLDTVHIETLKSGLAA